MTPEDTVADAVAAAIKAASLTLPADPSPLAVPVRRINYPHIEDFKECDITTVVYATEVETTRLSRASVQTDVTVAAMVGHYVPRTSVELQSNLKSLSYEIEQVMRGPNPMDAYRWVSVERLTFVPEWFERGLFASIITAVYRRTGGAL